MSACSSCWKRGLPWRGSNRCRNVRFSSSPAFVAQVTHSAGSKSTSGLKIPALAKDLWRTVLAGRRISALHFTEAVEPPEAISCQMSHRSRREVVSVGRAGLDVVKDWGFRHVWRKHSNLEVNGKSGIGNTRLTLNSRRLSHAQPFGERVSDLACATGISQIPRLRRIYARARALPRKNRSVNRGHLSSRQMRQGTKTAKARCHPSIAEFRWVLQAVLGQTRRVGFVKDPLSFKPLLFAEDAQFWAGARQRCASGAIPGRLRPRGPKQGK